MAYHRWSYEERGAELKLKVRAIVVDIDGTLTDKNKIIFTQGIEALRRVQNGERASASHQVTCFPSHMDFQHISV